MSSVFREERLFLAIGGVDDALVAEAADPVPARRRGPGWTRWGGMAAALALVVAGVGLGGLLPRMGASSGGSGVRQENSSSAAAPGTMTFMSYAGPALPLTVLDGPEGLPAEREVTWDFSDAVKGRSSLGRAAVTDETVLRNEGGTELTVRVGYPVPASLSGDPALLPVLTVDGETEELTLEWGSTNLWGEAPRESWEDYCLLLEDGSNLAETQEEPPALDYTVTVWEISGSTAPAVDTREMAPTLAVTFRAEEGTRVLTYGFNGLSIEDDGTRRYDYFVPRSDERDQRRLLIFVGEAPAEYVMEGYTDGGCRTPLEGVTGHLSAFTAPLGELLDRLAEENLRRYREEAIDRLAELQAEVRRLAARVLAGEKDRYGDMLEDLISHALVGTRVVWSTAEVTLPAGGTATVTARYQKEPSFDYACADTRRQGLCGFDLATRLGSSLRFTALTARLTGAQGLALEEQDLGFQITGGTAQAQLDPAREHYYMVLRVTGE